MQELLHSLGIDWHLFLGQAVNFLILLVVLRAVAYKPLVELMKNRRTEIEEGLVKAQEADKRLGQVQEIAKEKMKEAERDALALIKRGEEDAKQLESRLLAQAREKETALIAGAELKANARADEIREASKQEAVALVRAAIVRTVELSPEKIDEALVRKAVTEIAASH